MAAERLLAVLTPFDLARTAAPVWWSRGRWPNHDWIDGRLAWVGWEGDRIVSRCVLQVDEETLSIWGTASAHHDAGWARRVLGAATTMPVFTDPILSALASRHTGLRPWAAGSLYEGVVSSIVGQSISVAAAAVTERRLYAQLNPGMPLLGRSFWPPPRPAQLASADVAAVRACGVTTKRAEALIAVGKAFAGGGDVDRDADLQRARVYAGSLREIPGIGPWTVRSSLLWGVGDDDAHPSGDVALLRATRRHFPTVATLKDLDRLAETWAPARGWAARLLWLDLLGYPQPGRAE